MNSILLGLASGLCWGTADFFGGLQSRKLPVLVVTIWSQIAAALALAVVIGVLGVAAVPEGVAWGALSGVFGALGLLAFYRGLAVGPMSIVAPISACGAAVPVVAAFVLGEPPSALAMAGIGAAMAGVVVVSMPAEEATVASTRSGLWLALAAALGFGLFFVFLDRGTGAAAHPLWVVAGARAGSLTMLAVLLIATRRSLSWPRASLLPISMVGLADSLANVLFTFATSLGNLAVVSVLGSLYPLATMALARAFLGERLIGRQAAGVVMALAGVGLIAAG